MKQVIYDFNCHSCKRTVSVFDGLTTSVYCPFIGAGYHFYFINDFILHCDNFVCGVPEQQVLFDFP